jgi:ketosteroid isomerase-like protein
MMDAPDLNAIADRLFDAFVAHDYDVVESMLAEHATLTQNGVTSSFADARPMLEAVTAMIGQHRYDDVRRVIGNDAIVEEHHVVSTTPDGRDLDLAACVVIRVDGEGRITALDEYVDTSALR